MKRIIIFGIVIAAILLAAWVTRYLQQALRPRASVQRLLVYILVSLVVVLITTFLMVFLIIRLFPGELIK